MPRTSVAACKPRWRMGCHVTNISDDARPPQLHGKHQVWQQPAPQQITGMVIEREHGGGCGYREYVHWGGAAGTACHSPYDPTMSPPGLSASPCLPLRSRPPHPPPQHPLSPCFPQHARAQAALISGASNYTWYVETTLWACIVVNRNGIDL